MDPLPEPKATAEGPAQNAPKTQLPTPALSPVSERPAFELGQKDYESANGHGVNGNVDAGARDGDSKTPAVADGKAEHIPDAQAVNGQSDKASTVEKDAPLSPTSEKEREKERILKLSSTQIQELTSSPDSLPIRSASPQEPASSKFPDLGPKDNARSGSSSAQCGQGGPSPTKSGHVVDTIDPPVRPKMAKGPSDVRVPIEASKSPRPVSSRAVSTPVIRRKTSSIKPQGNPPETPNKPGKPVPPPLNIGEKSNAGASASLKPPAPPAENAPSPMPQTIPLPPLSMATYLQLELSAERPSPLYIYRPASADFPYESAKIKYERLLNFLLLPPQLERILIFGFFTCLDAFLYTFTILPLRFGKAVCMLAAWWIRTIWKETKDICNFVYWGLGRLWQRRGASKGVSGAATPVGDGTKSEAPSAVASPRSSSVSGDQARKDLFAPEQLKRASRYASYRHRRTKSMPSTLTPGHKADILKGLLVAGSCYVLMRFDASRMYHNIRGQAAIKLYVIYNVLEVFDRLFSALGQDVLECLFSQETLDRNSNGRSKVLRPFLMFLLALVYNVIHATALFYQVITLNVAVNSYSNALLTLLMSNQFVEIKGTVFKKFEKENLFQMTCADVVERFQLFLMLFIIAARNIVELGGLSMLSSSLTTSTRTAGNTTMPPVSGGSILPKSFTMFSWVNGQVLGPFLIVLGSEMLVDWLKHAYITKFNSVKPDIYGRFLDVLAKDYYSNAFAEQNLTKRVGLPVIPLSCLFIRAMVQTYKMFIATHVPFPIASSATSLSTESTATSSPATTAALAHIDQVFRRALGRSTFGAGINGTAESSFSWKSIDDVIALVFVVIMWGAAWFVLLACKLVLGMALLSFSRRRYKKMKERERMIVDTGGKRVGGWGQVEVQEEKRRWIYVDDPDGLKNLKDRDARAKQKEEKGVTVADLQGVDRYAMVAKRIW